jgi:hypothetical protein
MRVYEENDQLPLSGLTVLIYGDPGIGKTTLANTAPRPVILDFDRGAHRSSLRKKVLQFVNWQDVINCKHTLADVYAECDTVIVDTAGTLLDYMQQYLVEQDPKLATNSIKLWGALKKTFAEFFNPLRQLGKNIIFIAHAKEKEEGDIRIKRPLIAGSSYDLLMQSCDLVGYYTTQGNKRVLTFDLSDTITAKNCASIKPVVMGEVASMSTAMTDILQSTHKSLHAQEQEHREAITTVAQWTTFAETCDPETIFSELEQAKLKKSEKTAVWASVTAVMKTRGFEWNKELKIFLPDASWKAEAS